MPKKIKIRYGLVIAALVISAIPVKLLKYDRSAQKRQGLGTISGIPANVARWQGRDVYLEPGVFDILETRAIIHRSYRKSGRRVFLSIVYYADTKVGFHAPEACLGARGLELSKRSGQVRLDDQISIGINELVYRHENDRELVYYFYKAGSYLGASYLNLRLKIACAKLFFGGKSGSLIRVSTPIADNTGKTAEKTLSEFLHDLYPYILQHL